MFFAIAFGWTWLCWIAAAALGLSAETPAGGMLMLAGLLGPMLGGVICTRKRGKQAWREYGRRIIDVKRIGVRWYAIIALIVPLLFLVAVGIDMLLGGTGGYWEEGARQIVASPLSIIPFALPIFLIGPMEEFGWRGFALDWLQERHNALTSSLILGAAWSVWHLPLFFISGTYQNELGVGTQSFWLFMVGIVALNVTFTWIHNNTGRSILAAMLLHYMVNFTGQLWAFTPRADLFSILLWGAIAIALPLLFGADKLTGKRLLSGRSAAGLATARVR